MSRRCQNALPRAVSLASLAPLALAALASALVPACGEQGLVEVASLHVTIVADGTVDARQIDHLAVLIDGDGPTRVEKDLSLPKGFGASQSERYTPTAVSGVLVVGAVAYDAVGTILASGLADPLTVVPTTLIEVKVVLSSSGSVGGLVVDAGTQGEDLAHDVDAGAADLRADLGVDHGADLSADHRVDLKVGPAPDLARAADLAVASSADLSSPTSCVASACPLGCNVQLDRCNRPRPTNYGAIPDDSLFAQPVVIAVDTVLDTATGDATQAGQGVDLGFTYDTEQGTQPGDAPTLAVFGATSLRIAAGAHLRLVDSDHQSPGNAALFLVAGDVDVEGTIESGAAGAGQAMGSVRRPGPGGYAGSSDDNPGGGRGKCGGGSGMSGSGSDDGGGGGGALGGNGGDGAQGGKSKPGKGGKSVAGVASPLQGGCGGGTGSSAMGNDPTEGGGGGGAIEISAGGTLTLHPGSVVDVAGNGGEGGSEASAGGGGGAGGMVLLEAASVNVQAGALVSANGGGGGAGGNGQGLGSGMSGAPGPVAISVGGGGISSSSGGAGGWLTAIDGQSALMALSSQGGGGGGGGGLFVTVGAKVNGSAGTYSGVYQSYSVSSVY